MSTMGPDTPGQVRVYMLETYLMHFNECPTHHGSYEPNMVAAFPPAIAASLISRGIARENFPVSRIKFNEHHELTEPGFSGMYGPGIPFSFPKSVADPLIAAGVAVAA